MQGELGVGVQRRADLEGSWGRGTHAGRQHLGLAEGRGQGVAGRPGVALEVRQGEGARWAQVGRRGLRGHAVQGLLRGQHMGGLTCLLGTFWFWVVVSLWKRKNLSFNETSISHLITSKSASKSVTTVTVQTAASITMNCLLKEHSVISQSDSYFTAGKLKPSRKDLECDALPGECLLSFFIARLTNMVSGDTTLSYSSASHYLDICESIFYPHM